MCRGGDKEGEGGDRRQTRPRTTKVDENKTRIDDRNVRQASASAGAGRRSFGLSNGCDGRACQVPSGCVESPTACSPGPGTSAARPYATGNSVLLTSVLGAPAVRLSVRLGSC